MIDPMHMQCTLGLIYLYAKLTVDVRGEVGTWLFTDSRDAPKLRIRRLLRLFAATRAACHFVAAYSNKTAFALETLLFGPLCACNQ